MQLTLDGETWTLDFGELTGVDAKEFRKAVGVPLASVLADKEGFDLDVAAGLIWLARRLKEPTLSYADVAKAINFLSAFDVDIDGEATPDPET